jgi:hypothetical protein
MDDELLRDLEDLTDWMDFQEAVAEFEANLTLLEAG